MAPPPARSTRACCSICGARPSEKEAQALLIQAFVGEAIESIVNDGLRELAIAAARRWLEARA